jgi:hypothetical protein
MTRRHVETAEGVAAFVTLSNPAHFPKDLQMIADPALARSQAASNLTHGKLGLLEQAKDPQPCFVRKGP